MADYVTLSRKEFRDLAGSDTTGVLLREPGGPIVFYPPHPSTGTRIHEIYHAEISPNSTKSSMGPYEYALEEINAIRFTREHKGKSSVTLNDVFMLSRDMSGSWSSGVVMGSILRSLEESGIGPLTKEQRSKLWWFIKKEYKEVKDKR